MNNELMLYATGEAPVPRRDRAVAAEAKSIHDEVGTAAFKVAGAVALAGHSMEQLAGLDQHRRMLAQNDPVTNSILADIEQEALMSVKKIQRGLYNGWRS